MDDWIGLVSVQESQTGSYVVNKLPRFVFIHLSDKALATTFLAIREHQIRFAVADVEKDGTQQVLVDGIDN